MKTPSLDTKSMVVPPIDLKREYALLAPDIRARLDRVCASGRMVLGEEGAEFERRFAAFVGTEYAVGVSSGSDALYLALRALGVGRGDEVVTVSWTFIATVSAIIRTGATPVFVDIDPASFAMRPAGLERVITEKTRAILPVHMYGHPAPMADITSIARARSIPVIEDAAQAHGAVERNRKAGAWGDMGCFSFYPTKNLGAYGDAGAVTTNRKDLADKIRSLRAHGDSGKYTYEEDLGINARLDELQAAVLNVKLDHLESWIKSRGDAAVYYTEKLGALGHADLALPSEMENCRHAYYLYTLRTRDRDGLSTFLTDSGIGASVNYPIPIHRQRAFTKWGFAVDALPETERAAQEVLSLPLFPQITRDEQDFVVQKIHAYFGGRHS